jgi:hypothetical protein
MKQFSSFVKYRAIPAALRASCVSLRTYLPPTLEELDGPLVSLGGGAGAKGPEVPAHASSGVGLP